MELMIFAIAILALGFYAMPAIVWFIFIGIYSISFFELGILFWIPFFGLAVLLLKEDYRKEYISKKIYDFIRKKSLLPKISQTEQEALQAGTKWIESDFFEAKVNFNKVANEKITKLTQAEQDFLNNEVETLCNMTTDWEIFQNRDLSDEVWQYIKDNRFFGMIIPKEFDGLGFSATMHSHVIEKLVSRSQVLAITVMVPNSLGPAELILNHGTQEQKDYYLPRLALGKEVPCFALTEPNAGSDATSIQSYGELFKDENDEIKIKLNFEKRYITLGNIATLIGLAFNLRDPEGILGDQVDLGITFALVNSKLDGVDNSQRHDPLNIPFVNSPLWGKDVVIDIDDIIGGEKEIGKGWAMLVESLSVGRGISLPSVSLGGSKLALKVVSSYTQIREQFGLSINHFEGVEEKIAKITAFTYMLNAARNYTIDAIDNGQKPAVVNSIMKYHATEKFREVINDSMDILGGSAIIRGEKNLLAHAYFAIPISITVEGANILTRNLMQFGQGLIKCHPYLYNEVEAIENHNIEDFDKYLFSHISLVNKSIFKSIVHYFTRGFLSIPKGKFKRQRQKLLWMSAEFTALANTSLLFYGGELKKRENIGARFGDILSWCYLITATLREFDNNPKAYHKDLVEWICDYGFNEIQIAREELYYNMPFLKVLLPFIKLNPVGIKSRDKLNNKIVRQLKDEEYVSSLCDSVFISTDENDPLYKMDLAVKLMNQNEYIMLKIKDALKHGMIAKQPFESLLEDALEKEIISKDEFDEIKYMQTIKQDVINVNSYDSEVYKDQR